MSFWPSHRLLQRLARGWPEEAFGSVKGPQVNEKAFLRTQRAFIEFWGLTCDIDIRNMGCLGLDFGSTPFWLCDPW